MIDTDFEQTSMLEHLETAGGTPATSQERNFLEGNIPAFLERKTPHRSANEVLEVAYGSLPELLSAWRRSKGIDQGEAAKVTGIQDYPRLEKAEEVRLSPGELFRLHRAVSELVSFNQLLSLWLISTGEDDGYDR